MKEDGRRNVEPDQPAPTCDLLRSPTIASTLALANLAWCVLTEQTIEFSLGHAIALARAAYKAATIDDRDMPATIADEAGIL